MAQIKTVRSHDLENYRTSSTAYGELFQMKYLVLCILPLVYLLQEAERQLRDWEWRYHTLRRMLMIYDRASKSRRGSGCWFWSRSELLRQCIRSGSAVWNSIDDYQAFAKRQLALAVQ